MINASRRLVSSRLVSPRLHERARGGRRSSVGAVRFEEAAQRRGAQAGRHVLGGEARHVRVDRDAGVHCRGHTRSASRQQHRWDGRCMSTVRMWAQVRGRAGGV